jgi:hypothetical protein
MQTQADGVPLDYDLTCWYINARRVIELVGIKSIAADMRSLSALTEIDDNFRKLAVLNLSDTPVTLLGPFEKNSARWTRMPYINIHDGTTHTMKPPTIPVVAQTFETVFSQYIRHPEYKSFAPDGTPCKADSRGLLRRYPVTASDSEFHLIGKETERGWEQAEHISTLLPSLIRYEQKTGIAKQGLRELLQQVPLDVLQKKTGLCRHTILRARQGKRVYPRSLQLLKAAVSAAPNSETHKS